MSHTPGHNPIDPQFPSLDPNTGLYNFGKPVDLSTEYTSVVVSGTSSSLDSESLYKELGLQYKPSLGEERNLERLADKKELDRVAEYENQSALTQFGNVVFGGLSKGGLTLLENIGYIADIAEWSGLSDEEDKAYTNWLSESAKEGKQGVDYYLPIK